MSLPQYREQVSAKLDEQIQATAHYLATQCQAPLDVLRMYQGRIEGLRIAKDILSETFRENYG
jgi:hypothetical protein